MTDLDRKLRLETYRLSNLLRRPSCKIKRWACLLWGVLRARVIWELCKETFSEWYRDNVPRLAAVLSFYTIFSMAPTLIIVLALAASVVGESTARAEVMARIRYFIGPEAARAILAASEKARTEFSGLGATVISLTTLLFGATAVFAELQNALNTVWNVKLKPGLGWNAVIRTRLLSFAMVLGIGFLLLLSVIASATLSALSSFFRESLAVPPIVLQTVNFAVSFGLITVLFAMTYKVLPDAQIQWGDVGVGAAMTSLLFTTGKSLIGAYVGRSSLGSVYGAAGTFVIILLWVYYSAQVFLLGAEFTQVYARKYGSRIEPTENAVRDPLGSLNP